MLHNPHIKTAATLALALATIGPTAASARPIDGNPAGSASIQAPSQPTGVPPILAAAKRSQRAALQQAHQQERLAYLARHEQNGAQYSRAEMNAYAHATPIGIPSTVVHVVSHDGGFDWGDAGIGAAGGLALSMLGVGGALVISSQRRVSRHNIPAAPTS
jgi:hypothetical protein